VSAHSFFRQFKRLPVVLTLSVGFVHAALWWGFQEQRTAPEFYGRLASLSYTAFEGAKRERGDGYVPSAEQIRLDLAAMAPYTRAVRTYTATEGADLVPAIAEEYGIRVAPGAWLDNDPVRNQREIDSVIALAKKNRNVEAIYVGNELNVRGEIPLLKGETLTDKEKAVFADDATKPEVKRARETITIAHLIKVIRKVRAETGGRVPLSTGEIYTVWLDHPELVAAVDFIAIHVLPYWEGVPADKAVDNTIEMYNKLQAAYPNKRIKIAEFGWPSSGYNRFAAMPGRLEQASVMRDFAVRAEKLGIDYNVIEAFDQPWKTFEGSVGPYWGMISTARQPKFDWIGPLKDPGYQATALVAVSAGLLLSLLLMLAQARAAGRLTNAQSLVLAVATHGVGAWIGSIYGYWTGHYLVVGQVFAFALGLVLLVPLVIVALNLIAEIAQFMVGRAPRRLLTPGKLAQTTGTSPKVSIHIPACREPVEMLKATLDSVARLNYPDFECVVLINNTPDAAMCLPVEEHCRKLGARFKYVNVGQVKGFKALALTIALEHTAPEAEVIGVLDADYIVHPDWLKDLVPAFADARVGLVQAPQDHRDADRSPLHGAMNSEYAGFFDIGMVLRNESNAIITHGTMCLVRRRALEEAGGWSEDTICEDTDLGLSILEKGWLQHYTNRRYGHGLLPNSFQDYKKQRYRWASGGMQIVHKHWRAMLPGRSQLSPQQRRVFASGWLSWMANESIGVAIAILNILWTPVIAFLSIAVPDKILTLPILAMLFVSLAHFGLLYRRCVGMPLKDMALALAAHMSLQWTIARAVGSSLKMRKLVFVRTDKGAKARTGKVFPARGEAILGGLLLASALTVYLTNHTDVRELHIFSVVMVVQSLPFLFAVALATLERLPRRVPTLTSRDGNRGIERPLAPVPAPVQQAARIAVAHPLALHADEQEPAAVSRTAWSA
jgi:cellulose synthase/poly-beta-1,6-N-acetylglucosamine synthase-like glycosyltransferase/exo-beta-1,3-glucanase (GH17 family)